MVDRCERGVSRSGNMILFLKRDFLLYKCTKLEKDKGKGKGKSKSKRDRDASNNKEDREKEPACLLLISGYFHHFPAPSHQSHPLTHDCQLPATSIS